ncbi:Cytochrome c [Candidatus Nitrotoga sp. HW29]|uniref:c-type cytochrome n=1 Tax=Candidatus Nitrotoga sp. HW29 TaxID=2886963 RepID=UPI001EF33734|nr:c-type cytochrome [Candidatus Nitrotoga sp. HW29]CAH1904420.1 Cytochrome c [Candidatus Nitrotoga sp. HW29]
MKSGEKIVFVVIAIVVIGFMGRNLWRLNTIQEVDKGIPYFSTASATLERAATDIYRQQNCKSCHSLWTVRDLIKAVPAPILDGMGSLRNEDWFYQYFSASNPQTILPSRLKKEYQMPSYAQLPENERRVLARYMASLKVKDWYLEETRKAEHEMLTGHEYRP